MHRDLKCENIFFDKYDNLKLGDFGFAREMDSLSNTFCGSRAYAAPEILQVVLPLLSRISLQMKPYDDCLADVWSAGIVLYVTVTGVMPFSDKHVSQLIDEQNKHKIYYPHRPVMSSACKQLIHQILTPDAKKVRGSHLRSPHVFSASHLRADVQQRLAGRHAVGVPHRIRHLHPATAVGRQPLILVVSVIRSLPCLCSLCDCCMSITNLSVFTL